ncbi:MAG: queuosine precursor transporter [Candidatus Dependentiae bacterium]
MNELIFIAQALLISGTLLIALRMGKQALITFVAMQTIFANLFVLKQICLCSFDATASDAYAIGGLLGLNLLQEYYGKEDTKCAIWISFFIAIVFAIVSQLHLLYIPLASDMTQSAYCAILSATPRIVGASLITYLIVQYFDATLYGYLKKHMHQRFYIMRNYISVSISQLLDTILFSFLGLYGIVENVWHIILVSYVIKLAIVGLATPFLIFARWIKK